MLFTYAYVCLGKAVTMQTPVCVGHEHARLMRGLPGRPAVEGRLAPGHAAGAHAGEASPFLNLHTGTYVL